MLTATVVIVLVAHTSLAAQTTSAAQQPPPRDPKPVVKEAPWPPPGVHLPGKDATAPRLMREVKPSYTADAMRAKIQGHVVLEAIVQADGKVGEVRVKRSLDREFGLDNEAVACLKKWLFVPGMKAGVAVPTLISVELSFTLGN